MTNENNFGETWPIGYFEAYLQSLFIFSCDYIAIGNGVGCRETENFISKLIEKGAFAPRDVAYW